MCPEINDSDIRIEIPKHNKLNIYPLGSMGILITALFAPTLSLSLFALGCAWFIITEHESPCTIQYIINREIAVIIFHSILLQVRARCCLTCFI